MGSGPDEIYKAQVASEGREAFFTRLIEYLERRRNGDDQVGDLVDELDDLARQAGYLQFAYTHGDFGEALRQLAEGQQDAWHRFLGELFDGRCEDQVLRKILSYSPFRDRLNLVVRTYPDGRYCLVAVIGASAANDLFDELTGKCQQETTTQTWIVSVPLPRLREITTTQLPRRDGR